MDLKGVKITWLGHWTFLLQTPAGKKILVDPWLASNPKCPAQYHQVAVDAMLVTHGHQDHIGDIFTAHERCNGPIVGIYDLTAWLAHKGVPGDKLLGMNKGGTVALDGLDVKVTMTTAHHSSSWMEEDGTVVYLGEAAGYVVRFANDICIYVAGDTALFGDMQLIGELYRPDVAILPIGDHFTMDPRQAAYAAKLLGAPAVIPCHYATFPVLTGTVSQFERELKERGAPAAGNVLALEPGGTVG